MNYSSSYDTLQEGTTKSDFGDHGCNSIGITTTHEVLGSILSIKYTRRCGTTYITISEDQKSSRSSLVI